MSGGDEQCRPRVRPDLHARLSDDVRPVPAIGRGYQSDDSQPQALAGSGSERGRQMNAVTEIGPDLYRISVYVPQFDLQFNHFLVKDEEPLLYHAGLKGMAGVVRDAV